MPFCTYYVLGAFVDCVCMLKEIHKQSNMKGYRKDMLFVIFLLLLYHNNAAVTMLLE